MKHMYDHCKTQLTDTNGKLETVFMSQAYVHCMSQWTYTVIVPFIKLYILTIVWLRGEVYLCICYVNLIDNTWILKLDKGGCILFLFKLTI